jgi:hypothetical protein
MIGIPTTIRLNPASVYIGRVLSPYRGKISQPIDGHSPDIGRPLISTASGQRIANHGWIG